jgi:hypothetical protein
MDVERNARAQVLYREVNDRIYEVQETFGSPPSIQLVCECGRGCSDRITLTSAEYARLRQKSTDFLVAPAHHAPEVDRVVEDHGSWLLVEAVGVAAEIARRGPTG